MIECQTFAEACNAPNRLKIEAPSQSRATWRVYQTGDVLPEHHVPAASAAVPPVAKADIEAVLTGEINTHTHPGGPGGAAWGVITGLLSDQLDLQAALDAKSNSDHTHPPSVGGSGQLVVNLLADNAGLALTNQNVALQFLGNSHRFAQPIDLTNYTQVRLAVNKQAVAGAAASKIILRYLTVFNVTAANWLDIGASEVSVAINTTNSILTTAWIDLVAGAKADVIVAPLMSGGDGALDPAIGNVIAQFR